LECNPSIKSERNLQLDIGLNVGRGMNSALRRLWVKFSNAALEEL